MATPRRTHTITRLLLCLAVFGCGKDKSPSIKQDAPPAPPVADAAPVAAPTDAGASPNKITISVKEPKTPGTGFAKRCAVGGAPLASDCVGGSEGVAFDKAGKLYVANKTQLHRFTVAAGEPCKLEPDGEPLELPPNVERRQTVGKGPMYMRSGGIAWQLVQTKDEVLAHDFLVGLYRVDRGKAEPLCTDAFGFKTIVKVGKRYLAKRQGIEEIVTGKKCKTKSAGIDDKARDDIYAVGDTIYSGFSKLSRYDGTSAIELAGDKRLCAITAMTKCGDGACVVDHNCPKILQLAADDSVLREIDADALFDTRPWSIDGAVTAPDGSVFLYARHRDKVGDKDVCEAAVYVVPAAVFAR
jgi:hypothetical protein